MDRRNQSVSDWVEIVQRKEKMFANLLTGECCWELPAGVNVRRTNGAEWWQLFDSKMSRCYYYNIASGQSHWLPPAANANDDVVILPMATLQGFKDMADCEVAVKRAMSFSHRKAAVTDNCTQTEIVDKKDINCRLDEKSSSLFSASLSESSESADNNSADNLLPELSTSISAGTLPQQDSSHGDQVPSSDTVETGSQSPVITDNTLVSCVPADGNLASSQPVSGAVPVVTEPRSTTWSDNQITGIIKLDDVDVTQTTSEPAAAMMPHDHEDGTKLSADGGYDNSLPRLLVVSDSNGSDSKTTQRVDFYRTNTASLEVSTRAQEQQLSCDSAKPDDSTDQRMALSTDVGVEFYDRKLADRGLASDDQVLDNEKAAAKSDDLTGQRTALSIEKGLALHERELRQEASVISDDLTEQKIASSVHTDMDPESSQEVSAKSYDFAAEFQSSLRRHVRQRSEPLPAPVMTLPGASPAVSMDTSEPTAEPHQSALSSSLEQAPASNNSSKTASSSLIQQHELQYNAKAGSASLPSTPQYSRRNLSPAAAEATDASAAIDTNIYRRKQHQTSSSALGKFERVLRRRSLHKFDMTSSSYAAAAADGVDDVDADSKKLNSKRRSAPLFDTNNEFGLEHCVAEQLNDHKRGIFRQSVSIDSMLSWTKDAISRPMLRTSDKLVKKEAVEVFRQIQICMKDRPSKTTPMQAALDVMSRGWTHKQLRDEIFVQLCRQTTRNHRHDSLQRGWELLGICLSFFPPSSRFSGFLEGYICRQLTSNDDLQSLIVQCQRRLDYINKSGAKRGLKQPTVDEITQSLYLLSHPSMFGATLNDVMQMQAERFPGRRLPWIQTTLTDHVLRLNGPMTEGIFRVSGDVDEVNALKVQCGKYELPVCTDAHAPASLLKLWFRELAEPLIPQDFYVSAVTNCNDEVACTSLVSQLPPLNRLVLANLIHFLQVFALPHHVSVTKMDVSNLAMVWAPNCLRCESSAEPQLVFENARKEMSFLRALIQHLDTSFIDSVLLTCPCCEFTRPPDSTQHDDEDVLMF